MSNFILSMNDDIDRLRTLMRACGLLGVNETLVLRESGAGVFRLYTQRPGDTTDYPHSIFGLYGYLGETEREAECSMRAAIKSLTAVIESIEQGHD
jgi:hypothetical protein